MDGAAEAAAAAAASARAPAVGGAPPPSPPPGGWTLHNIGASGLAAVTLALLLLYLTFRFLWLYNKDAASSSSSPRPAPAAAAASTAPPQPLGSSSPSSLLPAFVLVHVSAPGPAAECAVCLSEFGEREDGRMLPRCGHGCFHEDCIATWLRVNTTCPLCRAPVAAMPTK